MEKLELEDFIDAFEKVKYDFFMRAGEEPTSFEMNPTTHKLLGKLLDKRISFHNGFYEKIRWRDIPVNRNVLMCLTAIVAKGDALIEPLVHLNQSRLMRTLGEESGQRIVINGSDNDLKFYDGVADVPKKPCRNILLGMMCKTCVWFKKCGSDGFCHFYPPGDGHPSVFKDSFCSYHEMVMDEMEN